LSGRKIIFAGLARDVAPFLEAVTRNIEGFAAGFSAWAVLVVENDSADNSKHLLRAWMDKARRLGAVRASLIELDGLALTHPVRTDRIAWRATASWRRSKGMRKSPGSIFSPCWTWIFPTPARCRRKNLPARSRRWRRTRPQPEFSPIRCRFITIYGL
jgi:hypothetical protein